MAATSPGADDPGVKEEPDAGMALAAVQKKEEEQQPVEAKVEVAPGALTPDTFRSSALKVLDELLEKFGGPVQYLQSELGSEPGPAWAKFAEELQVAFPCRPDLSYISGPVLPKQQLAGDTFKLSLWQLGWTAGVSTKPITYSVTAKALLDEFLVNSAITETEPLLLYQGPDTGLAKDSADNPIFFTHYVKGAARATSMLFLAHVVLHKLRADLESLQPGLYRSLTVLYGRVASAATDAQSIAVENARLSSRGAIRKSHDIITWLGKLAALKAKGLDPPQVIARYNESATRDSVLEGARRTALMQMLHFSKESTDILLKHVSRFGEKSAFTNEAFSNKRLCPGFVPRGIDKTWSKRLTVTEAGFKLFLRFVHEKHVRKQPKLRRKLEKSTLEEALNMAQLMVSCQDALSQQHPIPMKDFEEKAMNVFLQGDLNLELELQAAVSECKSSFQPAELNIFKPLIAASLAQRDEKLTSLGQGPRMSAGDLEKQAFEVVLASLEHDANCYKAWKIKCQDRDAALYFQQLQHTTNRHTRAREIADAVISDTQGPLWSLQLGVWKPTDTTNYQRVVRVAEHLSKLHQLGGKDEVMCLPVLNWAAPALYQSVTQVLQANLAGALVNGPGQNLGVCFSPVHFYKKGALHKQEAASMTLLTNACMNTDLRVALNFASKTDERERRALLQPGMLLLPTGDEKKYNATFQFWKTASIFSRPVIADARMIASSEMETIEDMSEEALPASSDMSTHVSQAEKHAQCGADAARKVLQALLPTTSRAAVLVVDTTAHTLDFAKATFLERTSGSRPGMSVYYAGFAETEGELEWQRYHLLTWLSDGFLSGEVPLPAGAPALGPEEVPKELVSSLPPKPELGTLVFTTKKVDGLPTLKTPDKILQAWHDHSVFGTRFQEWLAQTRPAIPLDVVGPGDAAAAPKASTAKREAAEGHPSEPSNKMARAKEEPASAGSAGPDLTPLPLSELPTPLAWQAALPQFGKNKSETKVLLAIGKRIFICNDSKTQDVELQRGTQIAGFYRGSFVLQKADDKESAARPADCHFELEDSSSLVLLEGKLVKLGEVVAQKRAISPLAVAICYHSMKEAPVPDDTTRFALTLTIKSSAIPSAERT